MRKLRRPAFGRVTLMKNSTRIFLVEQNKPSTKWRVRLRHLGQTINNLKDFFDSEQIAIVSAVQIASEMQPSVVVAHSDDGKIAYLFFPKQLIG